jgi:hypothetical protein
MAAQSVQGIPPTIEDDGLVFIFGVRHPNNINNLIPQTGFMCTPVTETTTQPISNPATEGSRFRDTSTGLHFDLKRGFKRPQMI